MTRTAISLLKLTAHWHWSILHCQSSQSRFSLTKELWTYLMGLTQLIMERFKQTSLGFSLHFATMESQADRCLRTASRETCSWSAATHSFIRSGILSSLVLQNLAEVLTSSTRKKTACIELYKGSKRKQLLECMKLSKAQQSTQSMFYLSFQSPRRETLS